ncbi:hypothetical protein EVAR_75425_1 [Eumeta japonica]|uniref:Uncharacterized protein n=1 Tax=Eumeta variegata TaxID=151549 RepID=A0A4C1TL65_EUMVA|nr:hypothetical protein EVAR_75425_1 [Eumeta japonica]
MYLIHVREDISNLTLPHAVPHKEGGDESSQRLKAALETHSSLRNRIGKYQLNNFRDLNIGLPGQSFSIRT